MMFNFINYLQNTVTFSLVVVALLCSQSRSQAQAVPFTLKALKSEQVSVIKKDENLAMLAMIYQPDCSWCKRQGQTLAKIFNTCQSTVSIALIGTKGSVRQLKKELKHYHSAIPAFKAERRFLRSIGGYQASPTTLIFNTKGELIAKKRGFITQDKLAKVLDILTDGRCKI